MERCTTTTAWSDYKGVMQPVVETDMETSAAQNNGDISRDHDAFLMTEALRIAHNTPDVRQARIDAIKAKVLNGTYEIDARNIALALIRDEVDLMQR